MSRYVLPAGLVFCLAASLYAQINPLNPLVNPRYSPQGRSQANAQPVEVTGTIQGIARAGIVVANGPNQIWKVAIVSGSRWQVGTKVQVTGSATADNLRSGLIVELAADLDNRGAIQGKIDTLTITSVTKDKQMGIFADDNDFGGGGLDKPAKRAAKSAKGRVVVGHCHIVGRLIVARGGGLSVQAGRGGMSFELADQAKISVDMADLSLARLGQEVSVKGVSSPRQPSLIQATEVTVKLPEAADAGKADKKEPPAKPATKKPAKPATKDKDEGLPDPGNS